MFVLAEVQFFGNFGLITPYRLRFVLLPCRSQHRAPAIKISEITAAMANGVAAISLM